MGTTFLYVEGKSEKNRVTCWFRSQAGGTRQWRAIVDRFAELADEAAEGTGRTVSRPDAPKTFGRGARIVMPRRVYVKARVMLEQERVFARALRDRSFVIFDKGVAPKLVLNMARAFFIPGPASMTEHDDDRS